MTFRCRWVQRCQLSFCFRAGRQWWQGSGYFIRIWVWVWECTWVGWQQRYVPACPPHLPQVIMLEEEIEKTRNVWHKQKSSCPLSLQSVGPFHTSALWDQLDGSTGPSKGCMVAYHKNVQQVREIYSSLAMEALIFPLDYSWISMFSAQIEQCEFEQVIFVFPQQDHKSPIPSDSVTRQVWNHFVVICALYSTWVYFT